MAAARRHLRFSAVLLAPKSPIIFEVIDLMVGQTGETSNPEVLQTLLKWNEHLVQNVPEFGEPSP